MKPLRGKRVDPQSRPGEFNSLPSRRAVRSGSVRTRRAADGRRRGVHFLRVERHDRFAGGEKPERKVTCVLRPEVLRLSAVRSSADRGSAASHLPSALRMRSTGLDCLQCWPTACLDLGWGARGAFGSVANRSVLHPTRLETRTKESNMCASHGVLRNLKAQ